MLGYGDQKFLSCMGTSMYTGFSVSANQTERVDQETYVKVISNLNLPRSVDQCFFMVIYTRTKRL